MTQPNVVSLTNMSSDQIRANLRSCLAWCGPRTKDRPVVDDWRSLLRSPELAPAAANVFPESCHTPFSESLLRAMVDFLTVRAERGASNAGPLTDERVEAELYRPHSLLVTDWAFSLFDGMVELETNSFIDFDGMPPWDTWVGLHKVDGSVGETCLLSWIPSWAEGAVLRGISVATSGCYTWAVLRDFDPPMTSGWRRI